VKYVKVILCDLDGVFSRCYLRSRSRWPHCIRGGSAAARFGVAGSNTTGDHGFMSLVNAVCCQVDVSTSGRTLVQRSSTECVCVSVLCVIRCSNSHLHLQRVVRTGQTKAEKRLSGSHSVLWIQSKCQHAWIAIRVHSAACSITVSNSRTVISIQQLDYWVCRLNINSLLKVVGILSPYALWHLIIFCRVICIYV
jgi:hypothetical protein